MKKKHTLRLSLAMLAGIALSGSLSSCAGMWFGADTDLNFTQPGGFGIDIGLSSPMIPIGGQTVPPRPTVPAGRPASALRSSRMGTLLAP